MSENQRIRTSNFHLYLTEKENALLSKSAYELNMSKGEYLRNLILYGSSKPESIFSVEDQKQIVSKLKEIGETINVIARQTCLVSEITQDEVEALHHSYHMLMDLLEETLEKTGENLEKA